MTLVVDASVLMARLLDTGRDGEWARDALADEALCAPQLLHAEVANVLRKAALSGQVSQAECAIAHQNALALPIELFSYAVVSDRVWSLLHAVTTYDAWYVALAELLGCPLVTLDRRLSRAPGPRCAFLTPAS